jgi:hypothetical protein
MANNLHSVIRINGTDYDITAKKVDNSLTIKAGGSEITFDGSEAKNIEITNQNAFSKIAVNGQSTVESASTTDTLTLVAGENINIATDVDNKSITINATGGGSSEISETASKIQVTMDNGTKDATITIKSGDPTGGNVGDIWFKY